jgi:predicted N-acetyltransferase YhbS
MAFSAPEPLRGKHDFGDFSCGEDSLDVWLHRYSRHAEASRSARVYVTTDGRQVAGYYALTVGQVEHAEATARLLKGQPAEASVPIVLLGRLAVDRRHQHNGLGRSLLHDALLRCADASKAVGIRALIVHSHPEAGPFYERFGFERSPTDPSHLALLVTDLEKLLAELGRDP